MSDIEFLLCLLAVVALLARLAGKLNVPVPVLLVVGGLALACVPGLPTVHLEPEVVLLIFLPPLLYHAAFLSSPRELRSEAGPITALAVGLVLATIFTVAAVAHVVGDLPWPQAFVLGAIVSPTDPVAATTLFRRLGLPARLTTILEGESLVNDGTGLVAFRVALTAATAGTFSVLAAAGEFALSAIGGVAIGLVAGLLVTRVRRHVDEPQIEITISLFTPFLAYIPAEQLGVSGVLAAVTVGLFLAYQSPTGLFHPSTRLQATAFWDVLVFLLNSLLFVLVGLQFREILENLDGSPAFVAGLAVAVVATVIGTRMVWMLLVPHLRFIRNRAPTPVKERVLLGWSGMRGAVSLAAALSIPLDVPGRDLILFLTFTVIVATLVGQGLTLKALADRLVPEEEDDEERTRAEAHARAEAARAAIAELEKASEDDAVPREAARYARKRYELRLRHLHEEEDERTLPAARDLQRRLVGAERRTIERLHADGELDQETVRRLERELDLEEERWQEMEESTLS